VPEGRARPDRYGLVLVLLVLSYVSSALFPQPPARVVVLAMYATALLLALWTGDPPVRNRRRVRWTLLAGSMLAGLGAVLAPGRGADAALALWIAAVLGLTAAVVVRRILRHRVVTMQTIFGALSAYLLIGFTFASLFTACARLDESPFFAGGQPTDSATMQYFSFATLTTTGYGDLTAAGNAGRALAVMDALLGQIFLVTLVARLVALFGTSRPGFPDGRPVTSGPGDERAR
jgi:hypothetical protein